MTQATTPQKEPLTVQMIRRQNRAQVLRLLVRHKEVLRSQLAERAGISTMTVKKIVDELLARGLVAEKKVDSPSGRKPMALALAPGLGCLLALNLSSKSSIRLRLSDVHGKVLKAASFPTGRDYLTALDGVLATGREWVEKSGLACLGAGLAVPSVYFEAEDRLNNDLIEAFSTLHPRRLMRDYFPDVSVHILQDVRAAAENYRQTGEDSLFYLYLGDGVGGCFMKDGEVLAGAGGMAGEVGQCLLADGAGETTLEAAASLAGLYGALGLLPGGDTPALESLYAGGPPAARRAIDKAADVAAHALYNLSWVLDPAAVVVDSSDSFYAQLVAEAANRLAARPRPGGLPSGLRARGAPGGQSATLDGLCAHMAEAWIESAAE